MRRTLRYIGRQNEELVIEHRFENAEHYGDREFTAEAGEDTFELSIDQSTGRDRDGYDSSECADIELNEEELRELIILGTLWLEQRRTTKEDPQHD